MDFICCGVNAEIVNPVAHPQGVAPEEQVQGVGIMCHVCNRKATGKDFEDAIKNYGEPTKKEAVKSKSVQKRENIQRCKPMYENMNNGPQNHATNRNENQLTVMMNNPAYLMELASPVIGEDSGAVERLIKNNFRYLESSKHLAKLWQKPESQQSLIHATEEAMIMGAELGKMGDIVPYGDSCEFIPSIEAYEFSLTNGKNAPFQDLNIELIHKGDDCSVKRKDGDFSIDLTMGIPRGEVVAVAVYGTFRDGKVLGELYDVDRLMKKAEEHSSSYQYFLRDKLYAEQLKSEGKTQMQNGREYFEKEMSGKNGPWRKKIFLDELTNPYDGADRPEMLRKTAGKSFCRKFARVRNAEAAREEIKSSKSAVERTLNMAEESIPVEYETN